VVVIRVQDAVLTADPALAAGDAQDLIEGKIGQLAVDLEAARKEKRKAGRLQMGELHE
jgi:hypothetical protein